MSYLDLTTIANASNISTSDNPAFTLDDFASLYPGFDEDAEGNRVVSPEIIEMYINLANACIKESRFNDYWKMCMGLFVAHFLTLWLQGSVSAGSNSAKVVEAGKAKGLVTSKSAGDISLGIDYNSISQDIDGWAAWKLTTFGTQLATISKLVSRGGMMIW